MLLSANVTLKIANTTRLNKYIEGFEKTFGPKLPIDFDLHITNIGNFTSDKSNKFLHAELDLELALSVAYPNGTIVKAGYLDFQKIEVDLKISVENNKAHFTLINAKVGKIFTNVP